MELNKPRDLKRPSKEFEEAIIHSGSILIECQLCGRTHFGGYEAEGALIQHLGEGEYKELLKNAERNPDKYIQHDTEMVSWGDIDGKQAVIGCECNKLSEYESFIWNHRYIISDYLSSRADMILKRANGEKGLASKIKKSVDSIK